MTTVVKQGLSSEQRVRWFCKGYDTGDLNQGDTFQADRL